MTAQSVLKNAAQQRYDRSMRLRLANLYYDDSGFFNFGYWTPDTKSQRAASANLVSQLLATIPEKKGTILDVACGMGATTDVLREQYPAGSVYAVSISPLQVGMAAARARGCGFAAMDATHIGFADESFDNIICVEAAFHFTTRADFLREAFRLLKPGGRLVHSDILQPPNRGVRVNYLAGPEYLKAELERTGFTEVDVLDRTNECIGGVSNNLKVWPSQALKQRRITLAEYVYMKGFSFAFRYLLRTRYRYYLLSTARKPLA